MFCQSTPFGEEERALEHWKVRELMDYPGSERLNNLCKVLSYPVNKLHLVITPSTAIYC